MKPRYRSLVLAAIVLLSATVPALGATPDAEFESDVVEVTAGKTADITVALSDADAAVVTIGSEKVNYIATVVVRDGNDDGTVTLRYDTEKAGHGGAFSAADDADDVTVESEDEFPEDHLLAAGAYGLSVAPGDDANTSDETDVATLSVTEPPETQTATETETSTPGQYAGHSDDIEDGVVVAPAQNQTITGTLDLEPGTEIVVVAKKDGAFLKTHPTIVGEDGRFSASFDFDEISTEDPEFEIRIRAGGETVEEVTGTFETSPTTERAIQDETTQETEESPQDSTVPGFGLTTGAAALTAAALLLHRQG